MNKTSFFLIGVTGLLLAGCDDVYSAAVKYPVRSDPLVLTEQLGDERYEPDSPGVLPILLAKDLQDPRNPMYPNRDTLFVKGKLLDPALLEADDRNKIEAALNDLFGSPAKPKVKLGDTVRDTLKLGTEQLERGSQLYRINCLFCHGVTGDGRGPNARWLNPHPRDYRRALFKFQSVNQTDGPTRPPLREDLYHTIYHGVESTGMPAFNMFPPDDINAIVSYVIHLSIRGKTEVDSIQQGFSYNAKTDRLELKEESLADNGWTYIKDMVLAYANLTANSWVEAQGQKIKVATYPYKDGDADADKAALKESVLRGYQYFTGVKGNPIAEKANCVSCHKDFGRQAAYKFDFWGTLSKPRNLTDGIFRGGRAPVEVYYRIHSGINGAGMPPFGNLEKSDPKAVWDLVNFVQTLPYVGMRESYGIHIDGP